MPRRIKGFEEQDAYTGWRRVLFWQRGELKKVKRRTHHRERREGTLQRDYEYQLWLDDLRERSLEED